MRTSLWDHSPRRSLWRSRVKRFFGYTYFLVKGLVKVRAEWSLITLAYNLTNACSNLVSLEQLLAAVGKPTLQNL